MLTLYLRCRFLIGRQFVCPPFLGAGLYIFNNQVWPSSFKAGSVWFKWHGTLRWTGMITTFGLSSTVLVLCCWYGSVSARRELTSSEEPDTLTCTLRSPTAAAPTCVHGSADQNQAPYLSKHSTSCRHEILLSQIKFNEINHTRGEKSHRPCEWIFCLACGFCLPCRPSVMSSKMFLMFWGGPFARFHSSLPTIVDKRNGKNSERKKPFGRKFLRTTSSDRKLCVWSKPPRWLIWPSHVRYHSFLKARGGNVPSSDWLMRPSVPQIKKNKTKF